MGTGQVKISQTGCSRQPPALQVRFVRPIWHAFEGVASVVRWFIGQHKVWEGEGWAWEEGEAEPATTPLNCGPSHTPPPSEAHSLNPAMNTEQIHLFNSIIHIYIGVCLA